MCAGQPGESLPLLLASSSPQRSAILAQLGVEFEAVAPGVDELRTGDPRSLVVENALRKARAAAAADAGGRRVLGADTTVVVDRRSLGKPHDEAEARIHLRALAGRVHEVLGGIALIVPGRAPRTAVSATRVRFRPLEPAQLDWYLATGEWRDRAGGYAIQGRGAALVESIEGDYWNVVGLSVYELGRLLPDVFRADA